MNTERINEVLKLLSKTAAEGKRVTRDVARTVSKKHDLKLEEANEVVAEWFTEYYSPYGDKVRKEDAVFTIRPNFYSTVNRSVVQSQQGVILSGPFVRLGFMRRGQWETSKTEAIEEIKRHFFNTSREIKYLARLDGDYLQKLAEVYDSQNVRDAIEYSERKRAEREEEARRTAKEGARRRVLQEFAEDMFGELEQSAHPVARELHAKISAKIEEAVQSAEEKYAKAN